MFGLILQGIASGRCIDGISRQPEADPPSKKSQTLDPDTAVRA